MDNVIKSRNELNSNIKRLIRIDKQAGHFQDHIHGDHVSNCSMLSIDTAYTIYWSAVEHAKMLNAVANEFGMTEKLKSELEKTEAIRDNIKSIFMSTNHALVAAVDIIK